MWLIGVHRAITGFQFFINHLIMSEESRGDKGDVDKDVERDGLTSEVETEAEVKTKEKTMGVANSGRGLEETDTDLDQLLDC